MRYMSFFAIASAEVHASQDDDVTIVRGFKVSPPLPQYHDATNVLAQIPEDPHVDLFVVEAPTRMEAGPPAFEAARGKSVPNVTVIKVRTESAPLPYGSDPFPWGSLITSP